MSTFAGFSTEEANRIWEDAYREARQESVARERRAIRHRRVKFSTEEAKRIWGDALREAKAESVARERRAVSYRHVPAKVKTTHH